MKPALVRMRSVTSDHVNDIEDVIELIETAENLNVSLEGCTSPEDMKVRIISGMKRKTKRNTHSLWNDERLEKMRAENEQKREALINIINCVSNSLCDSLNHLNNIFRQEGSDTDLSQHFLKRMRDLRSGVCNVLIAGQTNAGKSTLLNLLLGIDILPKSILSCTSSICKLRYSTTYQVVVVHGDGRQEQRSFENHHATRAFLDGTVAVQQEEAREAGSSFQEVHVLLPADILKCGVTIIDSPGFGENEAMDTVVRNFVSTNHVAAFIYIIKTDSSGGIQEDRLIRFLKSVLYIKNDHQDESHYFNPKAAMFVCNRWDLIDDEDKAKVKENALNKLRGVWPKLEDKQVCFSSSKSPDSDQLNTLLQGLDELFQLAKQVDITNSYCWLKHIVKECAFYLRAIVTQTNQTERDLRSTLGHATEKLGTLQSEADSIVASLKEELQRDPQIFSGKLRKYLESQEMKRHLNASQWDVEDLPGLQASREDASNKTIQRERDAVIIQRIIDILDESDLTQDFVSDFVEKMRSKLYEKMSALGEKMESITNELKDSTQSHASVSSYDFGFEDSNTETFRILLARRLSSSFTERVRTFVETEPSSAVPLVDFSKAIVRTVVDAIDNIDRLVHRSNNSRRGSLLKDSDPMTWMSKRAKKIAKNIAKDDTITMRLISRYTGRIVKEIDRVALHVPKFVKNIEALIVEITDLGSRTQLTKNDLQKTMEDLEMQKERVRGFGYMYVKEIMPDDIMMQFDDPRIRNSTTVKVDFGDSRDGDEKPVFVSQVLWSRFQKGTLSIDDTSESITTKYYIQQPADDNLFREIAKLRCLDSSSSIATFIGMTRVESLAAFIFLDTLSPAKTYLTRPITDTGCPYKLKDVVPMLLNGIVEGLENIHANGLVHMELSADTVMVNSSGDVKLSNMCLPRQAKFPEDRDVIQAGDFTCLSPEVLRGELYTKEADVYSFGLLIYEIMQPNRPYKTQRSMSLADFIEQLNPATMLVMPDRDTSKALFELMYGCVVVGANERLSVAEIGHFTRYLEDEDAFKSLDFVRCHGGPRRPSALWATNASLGFRS
ncbi:uncharacterized protein LOC124254743 [Haliotis rubra]|uniref:uncharacterized protein LOC124254743 n=1 Tax=Haliotis rubra TaxID=36100 RepID=UPI001EE4F87E|nr:uncharacterized protein LOC124254743 [Haliotis rubra]